MGPIKTKFTPMRNRAGQFIKSYIPTSPTSGASTSGHTHTMKAISPLKGKKLRRRPVGSASDTPRIGKKTSVVWHFFKSLPHENGISRAVCLLCKVVFKNPGGSTTGMRGHLDRKHPGVVERVIKAEEYGPHSSSSVPQKHEVTLQSIKPETRDSTSPLPPSLTVENGMIGRVGETQIFEDSMLCMDDSRTHNQSSTSQTIGGKHILPGPPPDAFTMTEAEETTKSIVLHLASSMTPVSAVENPFFIKMLQNLNGSYMMRATGGSQDDESILPFVTATMNNMYEDVKEEIKHGLQGKDISLSLDIWAKSNSEVYMLATANYISQEWRLTCKFLGLRLIPHLRTNSTTSICSEKISASLQSLLDEYSVKHDRIVNVILSAPSFKALPKLTSLPTLPCFIENLRNHYLLLNELFETFLQFDFLGECTKLAKDNLTNYEDIKHHPGAMVDCVKDFLLEPPDDVEQVKTHINIQYLSDFAKMQQPLTEILECFLEAPLARITPSSLIPMLCAMRDLYLLQSQSQFNLDKDTLSAVAEQINTSIQKSYGINLASKDIGNKTLAVCSFLDPRFKKMHFLNQDQQQVVYDTVVEYLYQYGQEKSDFPVNGTGTIISVRTENPDYASLNGNTTSSDPLNTNPPLVSTSPSTPQNGPSKIVAMLCKVVKRKYVPTPSTEAQKELMRYQNEETAALDMDPLQWWSGNCDKFPNLSAIAKRHFCIKIYNNSARLTFTKLKDNFFASLANIESKYLDKLICLRRHYVFGSEEPEGPEQNLKQEEDDQNIIVKTETFQMMDEET